jgi:hypothetical protein
MNIYRIDPATGAEIRFHTHRSGGHGSYHELSRHIFRKGETYTFQVDWQSSTQGSSGYDPNAPGKGPDYDYTFKVQPQGTYLGKLIPSWDSATGATNGTALAVTGASDVASTQQEFEQNYERRRVAIVAPKLEWQAIEGFDNLDTHIDPWTNTAKGKRIFPCRKNPDDNQLRHKLRLVATGGLKGVQLFVKSFDIDDSTSETFDLDAASANPVIDTNGKNGTDNYALDFLNTEFNGHFWDAPTKTWGSNESVKTFGANGSTSFDFRVGMQPGNNYRAVASVGDYLGYAAVQTDNPAAGTFLGHGLSQTGGAIASEPLTVWRRLWVENDSMESVNITGGSNSNFFPVTVQYAAEDTLSTIPNTGVAVVSEQIPHSPDQYEDGFFKPLSGGEWKVYRTRRLPNESHILTEGVAGGITGAAKLFDDDGRGLVQPQLPRLDMVNEQIKSYYRPSFIEVVSAADYNPNMFIPFKSNDDAFLTGTILDDARDLIDRPSLWSCTLVAAFQGAEDVDVDPKNVGETERYGETSGFDGNDQFAAVYVETCREAYGNGLTSTNIALLEVRRQRLDRFIIAVAAHEMGHFPGVQHPDEDHAEGKLMSNSLNDVDLLKPETATFNPKTLLRFRKSTRWAN